jgi:hypothetical protein
VNGITAGSQSDHLKGLYKTAQQELQRLRDLLTQAPDTQRADLERQIRLLQSDLAEKERQADFSLF